MSVANVVLGGGGGTKSRQTGFRPIEREILKERGRCERTIAKNERERAKAEKRMHTCIRRGDTAGGKQQARMVSIHMRNKARTGKMVGYLEQMRGELDAANSQGVLLGTMKKFSKFLRRTNIKIQGPALQKQIMRMEQERAKLKMNAGTGMEALDDMFEDDTDSDTEEEGMAETDANAIFQKAEEEARIRTRLELTSVPAPKTELLLQDARMGTPGDATLEQRFERLRNMR